MEPDMCSSKLKSNIDHTFTGDMNTPRLISSSILSSTSAAATEEARKEKNRLKVRRHYYRKLDSLNALRAEVATLELQLQKLLLQQQSSGSHTLIPMSTHPMLKELVTSTQKLIQEQELLLRRRRQQLEEFVHLRENFVAERDLYLASPLAKLIIRPFSIEECHRIRDQAIRDGLSFSNIHLKSRRGQGLAGWRDERITEEGLFKFSLQKTFYNIRAHTIKNLTWSLVSNPKVHEKLYSPAIEAKCVLVQEVDLHNIVIYQEWRTMDKSNRFIYMKSLFLVSLCETEAGYILVMRGLGEDRLQDRELFLPSVGTQAGQIVWHKVFSCSAFDRSGLYGNDTSILFSGVAPIIGQNASFWTYEIFLLALRWEYAIIGSPKLLSSSDNASNYNQVP